MEFASAVPLINGVESFVERSPSAIAGASGAVVSMVTALPETAERFPTASTA